MHELCGCVHWDREMPQLTHDNSNVLAGRPDELSKLHPRMAARSWVRRRLIRAGLSSRSVAGARLSRTGPPAMEPGYRNRFATASAESTVVPQACPNEAEFAGYLRLLKATDGAAVMALRPAVRASGPVLTVLEAVAALRAGDDEGFLRLRPPHPGAAARPPCPPSE
jgi:hypothetical protein